uniref:10 kDa heat shock protein, mitochondrial n=1 Tax=Cacopsylla melanoneura TaxID=428564 RepID=A0A8D8ZPD0_9HEMI
MAANAVPKIRSLSQKFKPLLDRILVIKDEPLTKTKGGVLIPEKAQQEVNNAVVIAVGPGARTPNGDYIKPNVNVGDKVLLPKFGGTKIDIDGEELHLFKESDLLAVIEKDS